MQPGMLPNHNLRSQVVEFFDVKRKKFEEMELKKEGKEG